MACNKSTDLDITSGEHLDRKNSMTYRNFIAVIFSLSPFNVVAIVIIFSKQMCTLNRIEKCKLKEMKRCASLSEGEVNDVRLKC